jgi:uncharacterized membrane protein
MPKITIKTEWRALLIIIAATALSYWAYPQLPATVASHWNFQGEVDGWMSKNFHSLFFPALLAIMYLVFSIMPYIDPKKERYAEFAKVYRLMRDAILFVLLGIFTVATFYNLKYSVNVGAIVAGLIGALMVVARLGFGSTGRVLNTAGSLPQTILASTRRRSLYHLCLIWCAILPIQAKPSLTRRWALAQPASRASDWADRSWASRRLNSISIPRKRGLRLNRSARMRFHFERDSCRCLEVDSDLLS